jgi:exodeoxyribonuclease V alpha subunit
MPLMDGDAYEAWVSGVDPETGELRGRVRTDEHALRFAEVVVNGPKSWSIAAELHPDIAAAYAGAQDRAATEIVRWMAQNAATRVGPRGAQVATPVERIEAVAVQHYTSRAGDPHRHIHVQINARVFAEGKWRGIDSVAVRNSIGAVQGIGHATVMTDPQFRAALAGHGFTLDPNTGEVLELAGYVEAFSKRAAQVTAQVEQYEAQWRAANPDSEPGPARRRSWDARAWAENRPGKAHVEPGAVLHDRWVEELATLGYQPPTRAVPLAGPRVGHVDRDEAAAEVLARLTASRSAWNQADLRGEAELLLARHGVIADPAVRAELAEDITARAAATAVPLPGLTRPVESMPGHIRFWTSTEAIAVEEDLTGRLAARGAAAAVAGRDASPDQVARTAAAAGVRLDPAQAEAAAALAGDHPLVLVTGAAGAGKTTTLAATRAALAEQGHQLVVVTPTLKAARGARAETGAHAGTVAWLVFQYGWRQDDAGRWTRLAVGDLDTARWARGGVYRGPREDAQLRPGDLVVVDEAGMLDQDTARALLVLADEQHARVALVGDPHQLPAIGRGGVLDIAGRWAERACTLDVIHRFVHTSEIEPGVYATVEDTDYAALSLRIRDGAAGEPAVVFDELADRGHVRLYSSGEQLRISVAQDAAAAWRAGRGAAVSVATNEAARALNAAIRDQLVATGDVDDGQTGGTVATTGTGQRIGAGELIATRDNDREVDVANRDTWTVLTVHQDGSLTVAPTAGSGLAGDRTLPASYVNRHVELGYAGTLHSVQGQTTHTGHLVLDEHTSAAAAYVGLTRGRTANTVHIVTGDAADPLGDARAQWIDAAGRGRPDLGIAAARAQAERAAAQYAPSTPARVDADDARLAQVLDQLRDAWTEQARAGEQLARLEPRLAHAQADATRREHNDRILAPLRDQMNTTRAAADAADQQAAAARDLLEQRAEQIQASLRADWDTDRPVAADAAHTVQAGAGRLGRLTGAHANVQDAHRLLEQWAQKWRPVQPELSDAAAAARVAGHHPDNDRITDALHGYAHHRAGQELPEQVQLIRAAEPARENAQNATKAYTQTAEPLERQETILHAASGWRDVAEDLPHLTEQTTTARTRLQVADRRVAQLTADPAITARDDPAGFLAAAHTSWNSDYTATQAAAAQQARHAATRQADQAAHQRMHDAHRHHGPSHGPTTGRDGPSIGR